MSGTTASDLPCSAERSTSSYRPEIDGLRAIAVLSVVAFHFFPAWCPGGFVGVDVFFVISGFLISGILYRTRASKKQTLISFYQHRVRRIFPALLIVMMTIGMAANFVLLADEFSEFRREAIASCAFVSNFVFADGANYFNQSSNSKVFLHLWSLSIEEQFYIFWPVVVLFGRHWRYRAPVFLAAMLGSLALSGLLGITHPLADFFSPLTRAWELGLGGFLAWKIEHHPGSVDSVFGEGKRPGNTALSSRSIAGVAGLVMVLGSIFLIDSAQPYPGILATLPTAGAFLIIAAGQTGPVARLLSARICVAIGRISYPLYLWHWPILVLGLLIFSDAMPLSLRLSLVVLALVLAQLTYTLVELPVRQALSLRRATFLLVGLMVLMAAIFSFIGTKQQADPVYLRGVRTWTGGINRQLLGWFSSDPGCITALGLENEAEVAGAGLFCSTSPGAGPIAVAVIGDSTANSLFPGLSELYARSGRRIINIGNGTCAPFRGLEGTFKYNTVCAAVNNRMYRYILGSADIKTVIWSVAPWDIVNMSIPGTPGEPTLDQLFDAIQPLVRHDLMQLTKAGKKVIFTFDMPRLGIDPRICISDPRRCIVSGAVITGALEPYRSKWLQLAATLPDICVFSQRDIFRRPDGDFQFTKDNLLLFRDDHHVSTLGSERVADAFSQSACFK